MAMMPAKLFVFANVLAHASAWSFGTSNHNNNKNGASMFSFANREEWLEKSSLKITYLGCRWSYVIRTGDEGCREDESGDGTQYWYQMANCRRANVAYALYDGSSGRCSKNTFLENFVGVTGVEDFAYMMNSYDYNNPISYEDIEDLPLSCEYGDGYYQVVGCSSTGEFTIDNFSDQYCTQYVGTYSKLKNLNKSIQKINCHECVQNTGGDDDGVSSLCAGLLYNSDVCSYSDSKMCSNPNGNRQYNSAATKVSRSFSSRSSGSDSSVAIKTKYFFGTLFLIASFGMFIGILLANRKKRRALLFRRSKGRSKRSERSTRERRKVDSGEYA